METLLGFIVGAIVVLVFDNVFARETIGRRRNHHYFMARDGQPGNVVVCRDNRCPHNAYARATTVYDQTIEK